MYLLGKWGSAPSVIDDNAFVELAQYCARVCHVLKSATEGRNLDAWSEFVEKATGSLERFVGSVHPSADCDEQP